MTLAGGDPFLLIPNNAELALLTPIPGAGRAYPMIVECASAIPAGWPTAGWVTVDQEIFRYTGKAGATLTGCTGEQQDTALIAHGAIAPVGLYITRDTYWPVINRASALAVYKLTVTATLTVGVKPGYLQCGDQAFYFAGGAAAGMAPAATSYITAKVNAAGAVVITSNTVGFIQNEIPLATVVTDATNVTSVTDARPHGGNPGNQEHALYTIRDCWDLGLGAVSPVTIPVALNIYMQKLYFDSPNISTVSQYEIGISILGAMPQLGLVSAALYYSDDDGATMVYQAGSNVNSVPLVGCLPAGQLVLPPGAGFDIRSDRQGGRQWYLALQFDAAAVVENWTFAGYGQVNTLLAPTLMYPVYDGGASGGINTWPTPIAAPAPSTVLFWGKVT